MSLQFNNEQMTEFKRLVAHYPEGKQKSALLPECTASGIEFSAG